MLIYTLLKKGGIEKATYYLWDESNRSFLKELPKLSNDLVKENIKLFIIVKDGINCLVLTAGYSVIIK